MSDEHSFLLQRVQPAMVGLIDGSLSTLAPIFSVAIVSHKPLYAFAAGLATSIGAAISMAFSEGLSDTGELTGRGSPALRGVDHRRRNVHRRDPAHAAVPDGTNYHGALVTAAVVVAFELVALAWIRWRFFGTSFVKSLGLVSVAGAVIALVGALVGAGV